MLVKSTWHCAAALIGACLQAGLGPSLRGSRRKKIMRSRTDCSVRSVRIRSPLRCICPPCPLFCVWRLRTVQLNDTGESFNSYCSSVLFCILRGNRQSVYVYKRAWLLWKTTAPQYNVGIQRDTSFQVVFLCLFCSVEQQWNGCFTKTLQSVNVTIMTIILGFQVYGWYKQGQIGVFNNSKSDYFSK